MRTPHIHLVCTPPCCAIWRGVALYAQNHPDFTAVQFEDCVESVRHQFGISFTDLLNEPKAHTELETEFSSFLEAGLDLHENMIVTGPLWSQAERQIVLEKIPAFYRVSAWSFPEMSQEEFFAINKTHRCEDRQWPQDKLLEVWTRYTPPQTTEGFDEILHLSEALDFTKPVVAA